MRNRSKVYKLLQDKLGCGPFDGGCVIMARALQIAFGGELMVILGTTLSRRVKAQHACVLLADGCLVDADGPLEPQKFLARYRENEFVNATSYRGLRDDDLPDTDRDEELSKKIAKLL